MWATGQGTPKESKMNLDTHTDNNWLVFFTDYMDNCRIILLVKDFTVLRAVNFLGNSDFRLSCKLESGPKNGHRSTVSRGRILGRNWNKNLKSFPPCYSQSPLLTDFTHPPPLKSGFKLVCKKVWELSDYAQKPQRNCSLIRLSEKYLLCCTANCPVVHNISWD